MPPDPAVERSDDVRAALHPLTWLASIGGWTALALAMTASVVHGHAPSANFLALLREAAPAWAVHALLTPPVLAYDAWLSGRDRPAWLQLTGHVAGVVVFVTVHHVLAMTVGGGGLLPWIWVVYLVLVLVARLLRNRRAARRREVRAERLERELAEARVAALQSKLQPHFLFNTLGAIGSTLRDDPDTARRMLTRLGDLLRSVLELERAVVTLGEDVDLLSPYVELQRLRHGERLTVEVVVPDELTQRRVPTLLLQPLVENAIRHGVEPRPGPGRIVVTAREHGGRLVVSVDDDGQGDSREELVERTGLGGLRRRLAELYGDAAELRVVCSEIAPVGRGFRVEVRLPVEGAA